jgi:hypothetical protein
MNKPLSKHSRIITIFRKVSFLEGAQAATAPEFMAMSKQSIGSYWETSTARKVGSGLSYDEQKLLLPALVDCEPTDRQFRDKVHEYFASMKTSIPYGKGKQLEIGLETDNKLPVSVDNMPLDIFEYVTYRHAIGHPEVAGSRSEADGNMLKKYYIYDPQEEEDAQVSTNRSNDEALEVYLKVKKESEQDKKAISKVDMLLTLLGVDPRTFTGKNGAALKLDKLKQIAQDTPNKLLDIHKDKLFEERYQIQTFINVGIFAKVGERIIDPNTGETIGHTLQEAIAFIKDPGKSEQLVMYKARLQEALAPVKTATEKAAGIAAAK